MVKDLLALYERGLDYANRLTADLPDDKICVQPAPNMNHAAWVIGHVAFVADKVAGNMVLGLERKMPAELDPLFNGKSKPDSNRALYPAKEVLMGYLRDGHQRVAAALASADPSLLEKINPSEALVKRFPTIGQALVHMMIGHEQMHLGQLSAWRRVQGLPPV